jgi:hypothetical protein
MQMKKKSGLILFLFISLVCCTSGNTSRVSLENARRIETQETEQDNQKEKNDIENTTGVIVLSDHYSKNEFVQIYNADGSVWHKFTFYDEEVFRERNTSFRPFAFHRDYFLLVLKCMGQSENRFEIVVNEENGERKYVKANDPVLKFQTWEEHILNNIFAVDFDRKQNPVLEAPGGRIKSVRFPKEVYFHPVEIKGGWLKIRWEGTKQAAAKNKVGNFGWIKWNKDKTLLLELFYFA